MQVRVEDRNDNPPDLNDFVIVVNNFRNHFPVAGVGVIPATDPDVNDRLRYSIVSGNSAGFLQLERDTGLLRLDPRLNSDVPSNGSMEVSATGACWRHLRRVVLLSCVSWRLKAAFFECASRSDLDRTHAKQIR